MDVQRLSEHILLGDVIAARDGSIYYSEYDKCGCALGRASLSAGGTGYLSDVKDQWPWVMKSYSGEHIGGAVWKGHFFTEIGGRFLLVCEGKMTIEALAQQVREWEDLYDDRLKPQVAEVSEVSEVSEPTQEKKEEVYSV